MRLYITRHGESLWNAENKVLGRTDIGLNERGKEQARELVKKLKDTKLDYVFTSPLSRAKDTAKEVADSKGIPLIVDDRLIEINFGDYEGIDRRSEAYQNERRDYFRRYPHGESYMDLAGRIYPLLQELKREYADKSVLLVSHGGICRVIHNYFVDMGNEEFVTYAFPNCGIEEFKL